MDALQFVDASAKSPFNAAVGFSSATPPVFVTVKICEALVRPTCVDAKLSVVGVDTNAAGARPVPDNVTFFVPRASVKVNTPVSEVAAVGAKLTVTEQAVLAVSVAPQLFVV